MKKALYLLSLLLFASILYSFRSDKCSLSYNGIYAIRLDEEHSAVLRFYEDGTVLASTSVNDYMDVMTWFNKDNRQMVLTGSYRIKKCKIRFDVSGMTGSQSYEGTISDNTLSVVITDEASKKSTSRTYTFYAL